MTNVSSGPTICLYLRVMANRSDLQSFDDFHRLIGLFYEHLLSSEMAYLFTDVAQIDLEPHVERVAHFWSSMLTGSNTYQGNPMEPHLKLNRLSPLNHEHFALWLRLFNLSVDSLFEGEIAEQTKSRAAQIASVMEFKVAQEGRPTIEIKTTDPR